MKREHTIISGITLIVLLFSSIPLSIAYAQIDIAVVHAVLFYSPSCPHCHQVIQEDIPPLFEKHGDKLNIVVIDTSLPSGQALYQAAIEHFSIPENRRGVPTLIVDNVVLVGSFEIPEQFPKLIEEYLALGGVDWPDIPGLLETLPSSANPDQPITSPEDQDSSWQNKFARDPIGNTLSIFVLVGMLVALSWVIITLFRSQTEASPIGSWTWLIPALCVIGFGVAGYLAYVETAQVAAVCGPIGDCNTVQQSEYARLFGILPIGVLGLVGYIAISISWVTARYARGLFVDVANIALLVFTAFGTLFSIYLTFLEPFVIGATCAWCLTSAVLMTTLMLLSTNLAKLAIKNIFPSIFLRSKKIRIG